jgi:hypothetical protein
VSVARQRRAERRTMDTLARRIEPGFFVPILISRMTWPVVLSLPEPTTSGSHCGVMAKESGKETNDDESLQPGGASLPHQHRAVGPGGLNTISMFEIEVKPECTGKVKRGKRTSWTEQHLSHWKSPCFRIKK